MTVTTEKALCQHCEATFDRATSGNGKNRRYCSDGCRKRAWDKTHACLCPDCGKARSDPRGIRCASCNHKRRHWASEVRIINAMRKWQEQHGRAPSEREWATVETARAGWPWFTSVVRTFGTWNNAVRAAGLQPRPPRGGTLD